MLKVSLFFKKSRIRAQEDIMRFGSKFFVRSTGLRHLGEMKTSTNDENWVAIKAPFNFSEMVNKHLNEK